MARGTRSQWDFGGELFAPSETRRVLSVTQLTQDVKRTLEGGFGQVWVSGEISNWRLQASGHAYFVLKDAAAQLSCVLFRGTGGIDRGSLRDGVDVVLRGAVTVYEARGQYQLRVEHAELKGVGALQAAFERLKQRLNAEGLFDPARKRPLPRYPRRIGLVTSPTAAALQDVRHVLERRHPGLELVLAPCRVQGDGAAAEIAAALDRLNRYAAGGGRLDCVLVTRGGGSLEDLWAFNEEGVARAIVRSALPVITGVGHEIDFTIADFAADLRAATPSAAAEILTAAWVAAREQVATEVERLGSVARFHAERHGSRLAERVRQLARQHPRRMLEARGQDLDDRVERLVRAAAREGRDRRAEGNRLFQRMAAFRPRPFLDRLKERRELAGRGMLAAARRHWVDRRARLDRLMAALRLLSPEQVLERGYSITFDAATGAVVRKAGDIRPGQRLRTRLASGELGSVATSARENPPPA